MPARKIKIGFIGAGSIGSLFGGYISGIKSSQFNFEIVFFCREEHAKRINNRGLKINLNGTIRNLKKLSAYKSYNDYNDQLSKHDKDFDYLFLSIKAYDLKNVISEYRDILGSCKFIVLLQNGIGNEELIKSYFDKNKMIRIITSHGAFLSRPGYLYHTGSGFTYIGFPFLILQELNKSVYEFHKFHLYLLKTLLDLADIQTIVVRNINQKVWEKSFSNIGINAIGALTRLKNGKLLEYKNIRQIMSKAVEEAVKVAKLKKIEIPDNDYVDLTFSIAKKTSENKNSMLQDILKEKKTEIDFLNGKIVEYAKELGIEVPINQILTSLIKGLERSY